MKKLIPLNYRVLRPKLDPKKLGFKTTSELPASQRFVGQERAVEAINFGIGIKGLGYNLFVMGPDGLGKRSFIRTVLRQFARTKPTPSDWCYIYNFSSSDQPIPIELPPGEGFAFQQAMKKLIEELKLSILSLFESDEYRLRMIEIQKDFEKKREDTKKIDDKTEQVPHLYRERHTREKELQLKFTLNVVRPYIDELKKKYEKYTKIIKYLDDVQSDIVEHVNEFIKLDEISGLVTFDNENPILTRYQVNLLVSNDKRKSLPIILEESPTYPNLISRVEHATQFGTLTTNFTLIKAGALHRANGGFLIIEARKIIKDKHAWDSLKSALYTEKIKIQPIENLGDTARPISLKPKSIPLNIKIVLLGDRNTYYKLSKTDPDFNELFKIPVDLDDQIDRNKENICLYAQLIATIIKRKKLRPFDASAVAAIIDQSSRLVEDVDKLSTHVQRIGDLIQESDYCASLHKKKIVAVDDVKQAIAAQIHRMDRSKELYYEDIKRNFILIQTSGKVVGQVNCLSVISVGKYSYGHPTRITAKVRIGKGKFIDIQRAVKLAGPIHSKATLIISNFLAERYNKSHLFCLNASIAYEQIYGTIEGDSASIAELCALLSALADIPIYQNLTITGSVNQFGEVQIVGGVNEKIEGYFDICRLRGLTGNQGVIIPAVNEKNLILREDIVEAVRQKKFSIYTVETIDQAMYILTGVNTGVQTKSGKYPKNTINYRVQNKLLEFYKHRR